MINVELHVVGGKHAGQVIPLNRKKFLIGRETDCQLRPNSELVSRHHCVFTVDDFSVRLRDLGSTNGTLVNGERIRKEVVLQPDDKVVVGSLEFRVAVNEVSEGSKTDQISASSEETIVAGTETLNEMPAIAPETVEPLAEPEAAAPPAPPAEMPPAGMSDTTVIGQPMMMPGQMPYQPMMPQHMGYPQMYGNYPYPGMGAPMGMYPQQGYPMQQGYPQQPAPSAPAQESASPASEASALNVSLPDPSETGIKEEPPKPAATDENQPASQEVKSNQSAAAIIQQQRNRRPGG